MNYCINCKYFSGRDERNIPRCKFGAKKNIYNELLCWKTSYIRGNNGKCPAYKKKWFKFWVKK